MSVHGQIPPCHLPFDGKQGSILSFAPSAKPSINRAFFSYGPFPFAEERVTGIRFYFIVHIDIFYYGCGLGHTFGVRVDGTSSRRFLGFLSLTAFQAEGCGGGFAADF